MSIDEMTEVIIENYPTMIEPQIYESSTNNYILNTKLPAVNEHNLRVLSRGRNRILSTSFEFNIDGSVSFKFRNIGDMSPLLTTIFR